MKSRIIATFSRLSRWISWLLLTEKWIYRVFPIIWGYVNFHNHRKRLQKIKNNIYLNKSVQGSKEYKERVLLINEHVFTDFWSHTAYRKVDSCAKRYLTAFEY